MTPLPPRRCARNALTAVRLMKPPWVMLMMQPSFAMRSSMLISPSSGTSWVRRGVAVFVANLAQLLLDDREDARFLREDVAQVLDRFDQLLVFVVDLVALQPGELIEAQIEDLIGLMFAESVTAVGQPRFVANQDADLLDLFPGELEREQFDPRFFAIGRSANDADEFIEVRQRDEVTFERFRALLGFAQFEARPAQDHFAAMLDVAADWLP